MEPQVQSECFILAEPEIEFRYQQRVHDPRDGLSLFGPFDADLPSHPESIIYGVIGTREGIEKLNLWSRRIIGPVLTESAGDEGRKQFDVRNWPHFPGFEAAFNCKWPEAPAWTHEIDKKQILQAICNKDSHKRAADVVEMYLQGIETAHKRDEGFNLLLCVAPDEVRRDCRPLSIVKEGDGYQPKKKEQVLRATHADLFDEYDPEDYLYSVDFRRQLKARAMVYGFPIQIFLESTLDFERNIDTGLKRDTPKSAVAWFSSSSMFYKAGGKPWRLSTARDGVCYIGFAFRRTEGLTDVGPNTACCAAQMFLDSGDGVVFKGEAGPWYSPETNECHLDSKSAENLLAGVLKTYADLEGKPLREIFLHSRSSIHTEEFEGYRKACPDGVKLTGIRVRIDGRGLKLFRAGQMPVLRGTYLPISNKTCYLWTSGFKLRLETYDGFDVPLPLRIDIQHGEADLRQVAEDILGLTKLNYNSCRLGDAQPVTVGFSNKVGEILITNPETPSVRPQFKFYI